MKLQKIGNIFSVIIMIFLFLFLADLGMFLDKDLTIEASEKHRIDEVGIGDWEYWDTENQEAEKGALYGHNKIETKEGRGFISDIYYGMISIPRDIWGRIRFTIYETIKIGKASIFSAISPRSRKETVLFLQDEIMSDSLTSLTDEKDRGKEDTQKNKGLNNLRDRIKEMEKEIEKLKEINEEYKKSDLMELESQEDDIYDIDEKELGENGERILGIKIDVNSAPKEYLIKIIHIGAARAEKLIELRPFLSLDDLIRVPGIGEKNIIDIKKEEIAFVDVSDLIIGEVEGKDSENEKSDDNGDEKEKANEKEDNEGKVAGAKISDPCLDGGKIDINRVGAEYLVFLDGIGETRAGNIVSYRKGQKFNRLDDLINVLGIGEGIVSKIREQGCGFVKNNNRGTRNSSGGSSSRGSGNNSAISPPSEKQTPMLGIIISEVQLLPTSNRFIEIYNNTNDSVDLTGWYIQRKTKVRTSWKPLVTKTKFKNKIVEAKSYFLVSRESLDNSDIILDNLTLTNDNSLVIKDLNGNIVDKVGFGDAQDYETTADSNPEMGKSIGRVWNEGSKKYTDTNNNASDFEVQSPTPGSKNSETPPLGVPDDQTTADILPPVRENGSPSQSEILGYGTSEISIGLTTNEIAVCKYSLGEGIDYNSMISVFSTIDGKSHSFLMTNLSNGSNHNLYIRCVDVLGNSNDDDFAVSFSVASSPSSADQAIDLDITPPNIIISEIQIEGEKKSHDFIELYNPTDQNIYLDNHGGFHIKLVKRTENGQSNTSIKSWQGDTASKIPAKGYYLWARSSRNEDYPSLISADTWTTAGIANDNGVGLLWKRGDESFTIDSLGWGDDFNNVLFENLAFSENPLAGKSLGRKWSSTNGGHYIDTNNNQNDFEIQTPTPGAQNIPLQSQ